MSTMSGNKAKNEKGRPKARVCVGDALIAAAFDRD
jgi:hypothetical protein